MNFDLIKQVLLTVMVTVSGEINPHAATIGG